MKNSKSSKSSNDPLSNGSFSDYVAYLNACETPDLTQLTQYESELDALMERARIEGKTGCSAVEVLKLHPFYLPAVLKLAMVITRQEADSNDPPPSDRMEVIAGLIYSHAHRISDRSTLEINWHETRDDLFIELAELGLWPLIENLATAEIDTPICSNEAIVNSTDMPGGAHLRMWKVVALARQCKLLAANETMYELRATTDEDDYAAEVSILDLAQRPTVQLGRSLDVAFKNLRDGECNEYVERLIEVLSDAQDDGRQLRMFRELCLSDYVDEEEPPVSSLRVAWLYQLVTMIPSLSLRFDEAASGISDDLGFDFGDRPEGLSDKGMIEWENERLAAHMVALQDQTLTLQTEGDRLRAELGLPYSASTEGRSDIASPVIWKPRL